jgi:hypothetical protein
MHFRLRIIAEIGESPVDEREAGRCSALMEHGNIFFIFERKQVANRLVNSAF